MFVILKTDARTLSEMLRSRRPRAGEPLSAPSARVPHRVHPDDVKPHEFSLSRDTPRAATSRVNSPSLISRSTHAFSLLGRLPERVMPHKRSFLLSRCVRSECP